MEETFVCMYVVVGPIPLLNTLKGVSKINKGYTAVEIIIASCQISEGVSLSSCRLPKHFLKQLHKLQRFLTGEVCSTCTVVRGFWWWCVVCVSVQKV